jgi:hypothetical protein
MLLGLLPCFEQRGPFTVDFHADSMRAVIHAITMMSFYPKGL